jgi:hypothetical protein
VPPRIEACVPSAIGYRLLAIFNESPCFPLICRNSLFFAGEPLAEILDPFSRNP